MTLTGFKPLKSEASKRKGDDAWKAVRGKLVKTAVTVTTADLPTNKCDCNIS